MFELQSQNFLTALDGARYRGLAYDGCYIYLTVHGTCTILQLDSCFQRKACFGTRRAYTAICYDSDNTCFWAAADGCQSAIYKLNNCLEEIDCIRVRDSAGCCRPVTGLSYRCCDHCLAVAFADEILQVCPACPEKAVCILRARHEFYLGVLSLCPYLLCYCLEGANGSIRLYSHSGQLLYKIPLPCGVGLEDAVFWPCTKDFCNCRLLILRTKQGCYPYLCEYTLTCGDVSRNLCQCNYEICRTCPCKEPCGDACSDVLESVALVEAALAHILNAEGEKIQKAVASTDDLCKILAVNESINKTMNKAIFLEQLLCCKLEDLDKCCGLCTRPEACE